MDILFTGHGDSNARDDNVRLQRNEADVLRNVDELTTVNKNYIRGAADLLSDYNWEGNVVYVSDVIVPPRCDGNL